MWTKAQTYAAQAVVMIGLSAPFGSARADAPGDDMLKPDEVDMNQDNVSNPKNKSGMFIGGGLGFGQARSTEEGASPGLGYLLKVEPGFQMGRGTWGRMEISGELMAGNLAFRTDDSNLGEVKVPVGFGLLAKFGYGYSLGDKMFGVAKVGVGPVLGKVKMDVGSSAYESGAISGLAAQLGWLMIIPMSDSFDATGGISWTHMQFSVDEVKGGGTTYEVDRTLLVNMPSVDVGVRLRL